MLDMFVADPTPSNPNARIDHVRGLAALPFVADALARFEPAVLMTSDGLGAIYSPTGAGQGSTLWFLADARALPDWESNRRHLVTLSFQSPDERVFLTVSGKAQVVTDPRATARMWRPTFKRWFAGGAADPRLLLLEFSPDDAEFYQATEGRVSAYLTQ